MPRALACCLLSFALVSPVWAASSILGRLLQPLAPSASDIAGQGCSWVKVFDPAVANLAYPDTSANYWLAVIPNPGALGRIRLRGHVPDARHFSFNSYDALTAPYDAIADYQIVPLAPGETPYRGPVQIDRSIPAGAGYAIDLAFADVPQVRAANTLYSNRLATLIGVTLPNPLAAVVIYRTYLPRGDYTGGAGLPAIELETPPGARISVGGGEDCSRLIHALLDPPLGSINSLLVQTGLPALPVALPPLGADQPPAFKISYGTPAALQDSGLPIPDILVTGSSFAGFFSTQNNRYASATFSRGLGQMYLVRGKAPTHVDGPSAGAPDLRYWSLCQNDFPSERVVACIPDERAVLDADGYYNVVVSDYYARPAAADAAHGFNWLPWGGYYYPFFIVRQLLPGPDYDPAFHNIPRGTDPQSIAGDYFPVATYCDPAVFDAVSGTGAKPEQVFEQCRQANP